MPIASITLKNLNLSSEQGVFVTDADGITFENVRVESKSGKPLQAARVKNSNLDVMK